MHQSIPATAGLTPGKFAFLLLWVAKAPPRNWQDEQMPRSSRWGGGVGRTQLELTDNQLLTLRIHGDGAFAKWAVFLKGVIEITPSEFPRQLVVCLKPENPFNIKYNFIWTWKTLPNHKITFTDTLPPTCIIHRSHSSFSLPDKKVHSLWDLGFWKTVPWQSGNTDKSYLR